MRGARAWTDGCQRMKNGLAAAERAEWSWLDELEINTKNEM
jgi:hypothetical protein